MFTEFNHDRRRFIGTAAMALAGTQLRVMGGCIEQQASAMERLPKEGRMPSLSGATSWLNSQPLDAASLRGKVVLVEFWTYTCVNWRRTLPYVRAWSAKYKESGLVVIGVHTPEFSFEHDVDNIRWALKDMKIDYPVAVDNDYAIWRAFENEYWPAIYLIDVKGRIRHHQFGEGEYRQCEAVIRELLAEAGAGGFSSEPVSVSPSAAEVAADLGNLRTPETYTGYGHMEDFASPGGDASKKHDSYIAPKRLRLNHWALAGDWTVGKELATLNRASGRIVFCFHARDVNLVMGPAARGNSLRFRVLIDGQPPGAAHGTDVDSSGSGAVLEQRLYQLIRQTTSIVDRHFEIEFLDPGVQAFDFTFG